MMQTNPLRFILSLVCGVAVAYFVTVFFQSYTPKLLGYAALEETADVYIFEKYLKNLPTKAIIAIIISTAIGAFMGGYTASRIAKEKKKIASLAVGVFATVIIVFMIIAFSFPTMLALGVSVVLIPFAYFGGSVARFNP